MEIDVIHIVSVRPIVATFNDLESPALEIAGTKGEHLALSMSGEGMKNLAESMLRFLEEHPQLSKKKSPPRH